MLPWTPEPSPFETAFAAQYPDRPASPASTTPTAARAPSTPANDYFDDWSDVLPACATG